MTTTSHRRKEGAPRARYVHLGDRLLAIGRIRCGIATVEEAARDLGVTREEILDWVAAHGSERLVTLTELRSQGSPEMLRLARRAQRLAGLVADAERHLRVLNQELVRGIAASNEPFAFSNNLDENPPMRAPSVAPAQPSHARARKFVDADSSR